MSDSDVELAALSPVRLLPPRAAGLALSTPLDDVVDDAARIRYEAGPAEGTTVAYRRHQRAFAAWCADVGRTPLPATSATLQSWVEQLMQAGRAPSTIYQAVAAVRSMHAEHGHGRAPGIDWLERMQDAHGRERATAEKKAALLSPDDLRAMLEQCPMDRLIGLRNRALLMLGVAIMARRSELAALDIDHPRDHPNGLDVHIGSSKTDQRARGVNVAVKFWANADACPVRLTRAWTDQLAAQGITSGPLFRRIDRHGHLDGAPGFAGRSGGKVGLSGQAVGMVLYRLALAAGLRNPSGVTAHSLRCSGATIAREAGGDTLEITRLGRWADGSRVALGYMRTVDRWRKHPLAGVEV